MSPVQHVVHIVTSGLLAVIEHEIIMWNFVYIQEEVTENTDRDVGCI
jgi:hypothetical protein